MLKSTLAKIIFINALLLVLFSCSLKKYQQYQQRAAAYEYHAAFFGKSKWIEDLYQKAVWEPTRELMIISVTAWADYVRWPQWIENLRSIQELGEKVQDLNRALQSSEEAKDFIEKINVEMKSDPFLNPNSIYHCVWLSRLPGSITTTCEPNLPGAYRYIVYDPNIRVSLNERDYRNDMTTQDLLQEIRAYYERTGFDTGIPNLVAGIRLSDDHIIRELDFMVYLLSRSPGKCGKNDCYEEARSFFQAHITKWLIEDFGDDFNICYVSTLPGKAVWATMVIMDWKELQDKCGGNIPRVSINQPYYQKVITMLSRALVLNAFLIQSECPAFGGCQIKKDNYIAADGTKENTPFVIVPPTNTLSGMSVYETACLQLQVSRGSNWIYVSEYIPESTDSEIPAWNYPAHCIVSIQGYPIRSHAFQPQIFVFPAAEYRHINPNAEEILKSLEEIITTHDLESKAGLFSPLEALWGGGPLFISNLKFLDFRNGSGIRFITQYGNGINPVNNFEIFYYFHGLTSDRKLYIAAIFPVQFPLLQDKPESSVPAGGIPFDVLDSSYYDKIKNLLEKGRSGFTPSIDILDELIGGLETKD